MDHDRLEKELSQLPHQKICWFANRCALRALPLLVDQKSDFSYWRENAEQHLFSIFRALNAGLAFIVEKRIESRAAASAASAAEAAYQAVSSARSCALAARSSAAASAAASASDIDFAVSSAVSSALASTLAAPSIVSAAAYTSAINADIKYIITTPEPTSWPDLWYGKSPNEWHRLLQNLQTCLYKIGLNYWADEYVNWIAGRFDSSKLDRCLFMQGSVILAGPGAMLAYLKAETLMGMAEARVVFLGEGGAGKTSIIRRLHGENLRFDEPATPRVEIRQQQESVNNEEVRVHYWDFGGQVIMHATHQFFLREKTIYIVVLDIRRCDSLEYWLDHVRFFAAEAPTLIVLNKVDQLPLDLSIQAPFDINRIRVKYPFVTETVFPLSCETSVGLPSFQMALRELIASHYILKKDTPPQWFRVKEVVADANRDFIERKEFDRICRQQGLEGKEAETALKVLDTLGVALYFPKLKYNDVVLNPEWLTKSIYFIIWASEKKGCDGKLSIDTVKNLFISACDAAIPALP